MQNISNYNSFHTIRNSDHAAGGISLFVIDKIKAKKIDNLSYSNNTIEICTVEIDYGKQHVFIMGIYRPHSDSIDNFITCFSDILNNKLLKNKFCIIMGDLNICLLKPNNSNLNFSNLLFSHHFNPLITKPTRFPQIEGEQPSCLDHIWVNKYYDLDVGIVNIDITDHLPTFLNIKFDLNQHEEKIKIQFRDINDINKQQFCNLLSNFNWNDIFSQNINLYAENLSATLDNLYCSAFPLKIKYIS